MSNDDVTAKLIIIGGYSLTRDIIHQISTLIDTLKKGESTELDSAHYRSVLTAITLLSFNTIEAYANFLAILAEKSNEGLSDAPKVKEELHYTEVDALLERKTYFEPRKMSIETQENSFLPTLDKFFVVPNLLAKLYGIEFKVDKGGKEWGSIRKLKNERDKITHLKFDLNLLPRAGDFERPDDMKKINPTYNINPKDVFDGIEGVRWYILLCGKLIQTIYREKVSWISLSGTDTVIYKMLSDYNKVFKICSDKSFQKNVLEIEKFEVEYEDDLVRSLSNLTGRANNSNVELKDLSRTGFFSNNDK
ncbi:hypothetical protein J2Z32_002954 [Paenibacillus turicensis]|uniref:SIR2-like domain-containing protein n=1 Tax=Paenibacillus turicensis TaxID=160487 RepID=A0ABS4FUR1_9BACL|nr:hypothetical protein [Paenibacillus turicensis]MBP1906305.1 hypothetical protein [Paenibacillus turicensis]